MNKVEKLSNITGLSQFKLRSILGGKIINFDFSDFLEGKEYLRKMEKNDPLRADVIAVILDMASSIDDIKFLFSSINFCGKLENNIIERWCEYVKDSKEAKYFYSEMPDGTFWKKRAKSLWEEISLQEVYISSNSIEAKNTWLFSPKDGEARVLAMQKLRFFLAVEINMSDDLNVIREIYNRCPDKIPEQEMAFVKWDMISIGGLKKIKTTEEAEKRYFSAPPKGVARMAILSKWRKLCKKEEDFRKLFFVVPFGSIEEENVYNSYNSFLLAKIKNSSTEEELIYIIKNSFSGMEAEEVAIKKLYSII